MIIAYCQQKETVMKYILIVEDSRTWLSDCAIIWSLKATECWLLMMANRPNWAINKAFDLVILDLLPKLDGLEVLENIQKERRICCSCLNCPSRGDRKSKGIKVGSR